MWWEVGVLQQQQQEHSRAVECPSTSPVKAVEKYFIVVKYTCNIKFIILTFLSVQFCGGKSIHVQPSHQLSPEL